MLIRNRFKNILKHYKFHTTTFPSQLMCCKYFQCAQEKHVFHLIVWACALVHLHMIDCAKSVEILWENKFYVKTSHSCGGECLEQKTACFVVSKVSTGFSRGNFLTYYISFFTKNDFY